MSQFYSYPPISVSASNPSIGVDGSPIPGSSTVVAGENPSGQTQPLQTDAAGNLLVNIASSTGPDDVNLAQVGGVAISEGQKTMANSLPVVIASDQSAVHTIVDSSALPTGAATAANQSTEITALGTIDTSVGTVNTSVGAVTTAVSAFSAKTAAGFVNVPFDNLVITYVGATTDIDTVVYKLGATTVATLTLSYDGSDRLTGVVRS